MLQVNVEARYTAQDVLSHPWVTVSDLMVRLYLCVCDCCESLDGR